MRDRPKEVSTAEIQPWHSLGGIENICELRKSCIVLYGIFTELARLVYSDRDGRLIGTPNVVWNLKRPEIWIDNELRWEAEHPEVRPAIYIQLGELKYTPYIEGHNGKITSADRFARSQYAQRVTGTVTFMHVGSTLGEACALADNTDYALTMMQDPISNDFCFTKFASVGRTPIAKIPNESKIRYLSSVTFMFEFSDEWVVRQEAPILKSIEIINSGGQNTMNNDNIVTEQKVSGTNQTKQ